MSDKLARTPQEIDQKAGSGKTLGKVKAVNEFLEQRSLTVDMRFDGRGGCWFIKP